MKITLKYLGFSVLIILTVTALYLMNLFSKKPYSIDHYLAKELVMSVIDSPEYMTYLGIFDGFNAISKHNQKLSISSLEDGEETHLENLEKLKILNSYDVDGLTKNQKITHEIAVFDTEIDIERFQSFRYHSYPFNQISGNHLNLVEFMTDTHPIRNEREAIDYVERVKMFDDALKANIFTLST